jgi:serine/threonine-protein kinase
LQSGGGPPIANASLANSAPVAKADGTGAVQPRVARGPSPVAGGRPVGADGSKPGPAAALAAGKPPPAQRAIPKPSRPKSGDEIYINQVLNNRFKVESKIGEGGFGAVYRGTQLATSRKVALKLLHPEMTKDENLVARFRREGMVLCNLRDAHTITTYDFDQTPDGTLYIAMELLEGKSLHQLFHEEAPLEWKRMFKILTEMCSSLAEAHAQGIVHRDLKPENIYLETRSGNPEFVKILDFGIAKVMRGDTIDPQAPQLTATGQTLGTLEYMSPEQLMGKPLDGRSDVYALGVLAYEMITGRLPFPDAKGPAGLITAQLKQTPPPPSQSYPKANLPPAADRAILKCLEKDKANRYVDVSALAIALQEVMAAPPPVTELEAIQQLPIPGSHRSSMSADMLETRRGELPNMLPPAMPKPPAMPPGPAPLPGMAHAPTAMPPGLGAIASPVPGARNEGSGLHPPGAAMPTAPGNDSVAAAIAMRRNAPTPPPPLGAPMPPTPPPGMMPMAPPAFAPQHPHHAHQPPHGVPAHMAGMRIPPSPPIAYPPYGARARPSGPKLLWWVLALLAVGVGVGTVIALVMSK